MKIAVIGIGCRYPGANSTDELFENILSGRRYFREVPAERWSFEDYYSVDRKHQDKTYCKRAAFIEGFEFDPAEYRIPKSTYFATDTAQWMALTVAKEALDDAGICPTENERTGVIMGNTLTGEVSRAFGLRFRWPYVKSVISELLDNLKIVDDRKESILDKVEVRYKAPFPTVNEDNLAGGLSNTIAGRICNYFDFKGGGFCTDGACSSSLLAINQACVGLSNNNFDLVLAGGVDISLDPFEIVGFAKVGALSDGDIKVYDKFANGFLPGEGCGVVVLQRYEDAVAQGRSIYAVVNGIGISSDGRGGITAPSVSGQSLAVKRAYDMADYDFADVELIEGHGTGTPTGDKVELTTFIENKQLDSPSLSHRCGIGSIKSNIGHTKAAAGVAGFIKAVMSVKYGILPPTQGIHSPNELFEKSKSLYPLIRGRCWEDSKEPRRAAVSSAGFGGINTHITLSSVIQEEHLSSSKKRDHYLSLLATHQNSEVFFIGAATLEDLSAELELLHAASRKISVAEVADMANYCSQHTLCNQIRLSFVASSSDQIEKILQRVITHITNVKSVDEIEFIDHNQSIYLRNRTHQPLIAFMFPGQSSQSTNMGKKHKDRCSTVDRFWERCDEILEPQLESKITNLIFCEPDSLSLEELEKRRSAMDNTAITQPAVTAASLANLAFLRDVGVRPDLALGHSLGEYSALCSAGVLDIETTLKLVATRGSVMSDSTDRKGAMLSVNTDVASIRELLSAVEGQYEGDISISNINSPSQTIISGDETAIEYMRNACEKAKLQSERLRVSSAFHSSLMHPAAEKMGDILEECQFGRLRHMVISPSTGGFISDDCDFVSVLKDQILNPVDFVSAIELAEKEGIDIFVEVGPGSILSGLARSILTNKKDLLICNSDIGDQGQYVNSLNKLFAYLYASGVALNRNKIFEGRFFRKFTLPYKASFISSPCEVAVSPLDLGISNTEVLDDVVNLALATTNTDEKTVSKKESLNSEKIDIPESVIDLLRSQIIREYGYSEDMLTPESKLQDDLGLDSLKSIELVHEVMGALQLQADVSHLQNASLEEISEYINELQTGEKSESTQVSDNVLDQIEENWVRVFELVTTSRPLLPNIPNNVELGGRYLLVYEKEDNVFNSIHNYLSDLNFDVDVIKADAIEFPTTNINGCIYLVNDPQPLKYWLDSDELVMTDKFIRPQALIKSANQLINSAVSTKKYFALIATQGAYLWSEGAGDKAPCFEAGAGFVKTLHLEHQEIETRCIDFDQQLEPQQLAQFLVNELHAIEGHIDSAYSNDGSDGIRTIAEYRAVKTEYMEHIDNPLRYNDVVLITGGGKGITAECAFSLAKNVGTRLALIGSSQIADEGELETNLKRFESEGINFRYYCCDVLDKNQVNNLIKNVESDLGPITAIIHGAGTNSLQKIHNAQWYKFERVLRIKMQGLTNLLTATNMDCMKSLMVFSSVIANSGMAGNAEYAYANEWINQLLKRIQMKYPQIACRAFGFSVWSDVGMGARMKSIDLLQNMGISSIPVNAGSDLFTLLTKKQWSNTSYMISSRMGEIDTLRFSRESVPKSRYVENILLHHPGIELVSEIFLHPENDLYLVDHNYEGSLLFPAVIGMEAMVQCAHFCYSSGERFHKKLPELRNLKFSNAIVVPVEGRFIRIYVNIQEPQANGDQSARISIRSSLTQYKQDYFSAECVWTQDFDKPKKRAAIESTYLHLSPSKDLYGKILFQGPMFQNILGYLELSAKHCIVEIALPPAKQSLNNDTKTENTLFGSSLVRDTFLHAVQLCVPQHKILPVSMSHVIHKGFYNESTNSQKVILYAYEVERTNNEYLYDLEIYNSEGYCVEDIKGFRCRIISEYDDHANLEVIMAAHRESAIMRSEKRIEMA